VVYEVTADELEDLEHGPPNSVLLTFAMLPLSVAASSLTALATMTIDSIRLLVVFTRVTAVGLLEDQSCSSCGIGSEGA
jgi:hypothetical protein